MSTDHGAGSVTKQREDGSPMEFDPYSDSFFDDPYETYRWMRDEAPVYYSERWDFYALTRHEDVVAAHRDWETFSSAYGVTLDVLSMRQRLSTNMLIIMDPPEHERLRKLVRQGFTKAAIANLEPLGGGGGISYIGALKGRENFPRRDHLLDARRPSGRTTADPVVDRRIPAPGGKQPVRHGKWCGSFDGDG